jgi:hypothetical protein
MSAVSSIFHIVINKTRTFEDEYRGLIEAYGLEWNDFRLT